MEPWTSRRAGILTKYTTSEKLSIVTSFLSEGEKGMIKNSVVIIYLTMPHW